MCLDVIPTQRVRLCSWAPTDLGRTRFLPKCIVIMVEINSEVHLDVVYRQACDFLRAYYAEASLTGLETRLAEVRQELDRDGIYTHTYAELVYGGKVAWRNSTRCIGRLFYDTLEVLDFRHVTAAADVMECLKTHLTHATNNGNIRSVLSVFRPKHPLTGDEIRIWNGKLVRYAGYEQTAGIVGDPDEVAFTRVCERMGWQGAGNPFDLLPIVIATPDASPVWFDAKPLAALEVPIRHPQYAWFASLGLRWYAVPVITDMVLEIGGLHYTAAPFNGWFMVTEIGSRNLGDASRYNQLPVIAEKLGLDTTSDKTFWKDRALVELNHAVYHSFREDGVRLVDHHTASRQFMSFCRREADAGRTVMADWSWIVPPQSGSTTAVFHQQWGNEVLSPNFYYNTPAWKRAESSSEGGRCPFHIQSRANRLNE